MSGPLAGKVAVITGSTRGFGRAMAEAFARAGAAVVVSSRSADAVERTVAELTHAGSPAAGRACDVGSLPDVRALLAQAIERFGKMDIWINNAGVGGPFGPTAHIPPELFLPTIHTNILGTYHGSLVALEHLLPRRTGRLINILGRGDRQAVPFQSGYASSKAWIRNFTQALAGEYKDAGVGIHAINPGLMTTDMLHEVSAVAGYEARLSPLKTIMRMWADPPELPAERVVWLASPDTDGRTGMEVQVLGTGRMLSGLLSELARRLFRRSAPEVSLDVRTVEPHLKS